MVIRSFRHRGLDRLFTRSERKGVPADFIARLERMLDRLDCANGPQDMDLPGYRFHALKGQRKGTYSVSVSGNWRLTFRWQGDDAVDVNLEDYH